MNENYTQVIDKLTVDLAEILEQIYTVKECEHASVTSIENGTGKSESESLIHKVISDLENAEMNIQHAIDLLSGTRD